MSKSEFETRKWWKSDPRRNLAIKRLYELGAKIKFEEGCLTVLLPTKQNSAVYAECGFLIAQLTDLNFPDEVFCGLSPIDSTLFSKETIFHPYQPVMMVENNQQGILYKIRLLNELERLKELQGH